MPPASKAKTASASTSTSASSSMSKALPAPMSDADISSFLASRVLHQKSAVTYRLLSREAQRHVDVVRETMMHFWEEQRDGEGGVKATFILQGRLKGVKSGDDVVDAQVEAAILLVGEDKLQATRQRFHSDDLCEQIYALSPAPSSSPSSSKKALTTTDIATFSTVPLLLESEDRYVQAWESADRGKSLGVIHNDRVRPGDPKAIAAAQQQAAQAKAKAQQQQQQPPSTSKKEAAPTAKSTTSTTKPPKSEAEGSTSRADGAKPGPEVKAGQSTKPAAKSGGLNWSKAKSKTAKPVKEAEPDSDKEDSRAASPSADGSDVEMAQIGYADSDADEGGDDDEDMDAKPAGRTKVKRADGAAKPKTPAPRSAPGSTKSQTQREEERKKLREMMEVEDQQDAPGEQIPDVDANAGASTSTMAGTDGAEEATASPDSRKRKIRRKKRTVRKERGKDAKGYTYTREVSDYESYSDWTESEETKSAAPPAKKSRTSKGSSAAAGGKNKPGNADDKKEGEKENEKEKEKDKGSNGAAAAAAAAPAPAKNKRTASATPAQAPAAKPKSGAGAGPGGQSKLSSFFSKRS